MFLAQGRVWLVRQVDSVRRFYRSIFWPLDLVFLDVVVQVLTTDVESPRCLRDIVISFGENCAYCLNGGLVF